MKERTLSNVKGSKINNGIKFYGKDLWQCITKAWNEEEGWMKSTKVLPLKNKGCMIQVITQQKNLDGSWCIVETVTYSPEYPVGYEK